MTKRIVFLCSIIFFCSLSAFALNTDFWLMVSDWATEEAGDDPAVDGCSFAPDGIRYNGRYISFRNVCDAHDRDYNNKVDKDVADKKLKDGIYDTLRANKVDVVTALAISNLYYAGVRSFGRYFY